MDVTSPLVGGCAALPFDRYTTEEADHKRYRCGSDPGQGKLRRRLAYGQHEGTYAPKAGPYGEGAGQQGQHTLPFIFFSFYYFFPLYLTKY